MVVMVTAPLDFVPLWALFVLVIALLCVALEAGYRIGRWRHSHILDEKEQPVSSMVASILGLVALVLGFTFNMAATRFDARRAAVLEEANAIGTTYLRTSLLPDPEKQESAGRLRAYVGVRIAAADKEKTIDAIRRSEELQAELWAQADSAFAKDPRSVAIGLYIQSLNEVIDVHAKRVVVSLRNRIPFVIWAGVIGLSTIGVGAVGYQAALTDTRRSPMMLVLILAFCVVLSLIADLDRGHEGLLRVSQQSMVDLQRSMKEGP